MARYLLFLPRRDAVSHEGGTPVGGRRWGVGLAPYGVEAREVTVPYERGTPIAPGLGGMDLAPESVEAHEMGGHVRECALQPGGRRQRHPTLRFRV